MLPAGPQRVEKLDTLQKRGSAKLAAPVRLRPSLGHTPSQKMSFSCLKATRTAFLL